MTNGEKFVTAQERAEAFFDWCVGYRDYNACKNCCIVKSCDCCPTKGILYWLDLEAEDEKPLPCPFCGGDCRMHSRMLMVVCDKTDCTYQSGIYETKEEAIAAHNRVAKAAREREVN